MTKKIKLSLLSIFFILLCRSLVADELYDASILEKEGKQEQAFHLYEQWLSAHQNDVKFPQILFYAASLIRSVDESIQFLEQNESFLSGKDKQQLFYRVAVLYEITFQKHKAVEYYEKASLNEDNTLNYNHYLKYLTAGYQLGEIPPMDKVDSILLSNPGRLLYIQALTFKSELLRYSGEINEALTILEQSIYRETSPEIQLALWKIYKYNDNSASAELISRRMEKDFPESIELKIIKGEVEQLPVLTDLFLPVKNTSLKSYAQVGTFSNEENAESLSEKLKSSGFESFYLNDKGRTRVIVVDSDSSGNLLVRLRTNGFDAFMIDYQSPD